MVSSPLAAGAALLLAALVPLPAQQAPQLTGEAPVMLATARYLFVLRGDVVYQFDLDTLALLHQARLPTEVVPLPPVAEPAPPPLPPAQAGRLARRAGQAVDLGLQWLAAHQDEDGRWDADEFMKHDREGAATDKPGTPTHDVAVTSLVMLAMLRHGSTLREGPYREQLKAAAKWLREQQQANGIFGIVAAHDFIYDHAIATLAMVEAYGRSEYKLLKSSAQNGINYLESHRNPYSVWRYQPRDNDNDTSVTGWCVRAYVAAQKYGLEVNGNALKLAATWFDEVTDETGRCGYTKKGEPSSRHPGDHATRFPVEKGEALTATGLDCRLLLGQRPDDAPVMHAAANRILSKPPAWGDETIDHYYWFAGSEALSRMDGRPWQEWQRALVPALVKAQRQDGNFAGSWDPAGPWGQDGGRVYATALLTLSLLPVADKE